LNNVYHTKEMSFLALLSKNIMLIEFLDF